MPEINTTTNAGQYIRTPTETEQRLRDISTEQEGKKSESGVLITKKRPDEYIAAIQVKASTVFDFQTVERWVNKLIPISSDTKSQRVDAGLIAGDKCVHAPSASLRLLPAIVSPNRTKNTVVSQDNRVDIIMVNGIMGSAEDHYNTMALMAKNLSAPIDRETERPLGKQAEFRGVHNGTDGFIQDLCQSVTDKITWGQNHAVATLREKIVDRVGAGKPVNIIAHSQGGIIVARALTEVRVMLQEGLELSRQDALDLMSKTVNVVTLGAAAWHYPSGPNYKHIANSADPVAMFAGAGVEDGVAHGILSLLGRGAAKLGHKLLKTLPIITSRYKLPWYFGAGADTPNKAEIIAEKLSNHWGIKAMENHYVDGPYNDYLAAHREEVMDFFDTADKDISEEVAKYIQLS